MKMLSTTFISIIYSHQSNATILFISPGEREWAREQRKASTNENNYGTYITYDYSCICMDWLSHMFKYVSTSENTKYYLIFFTLFITKP